MSVHLRVLTCGPATTLQDAGRRGLQRQGLSASGPMDSLAQAAANVLVGNPVDAPAIEFGLGGGRFRVEGGAVRCALAGASCAISVDGQPLADHRSFLLREGADLRIDRPRDGVFATLALAGGIAVPAVMGSVSLHPRAGIGGFHGRPLRDGDRIPLSPPAPSGEAEHRLDPVPLDPGCPIRIVLGPQDDHFTARGLATLLGGPFLVSRLADRMGYQLEGPRIEHAEQGFNIVSDGTVAGSIQVPGNGQPIVLLADRQTTGGYPKIATVISADLRRLAQRRPGERVVFAEVTLAEATRAARERAVEIATLADGLQPVVGEAERLALANLAGNAVDALSDDG